MSQRADIILEQNSTRVVEDLDVAFDPEEEPSVRLDPRSSAVRVGDGPEGVSTPSITLDGKNDRVLVNGEGQEGNVDPGVVLDGKGERVLLGGDSESEAAAAFDPNGIRIGDPGGESDATVSLLGGAERRLEIRGSAHSTTVSNERITVGSESDVEIHADNRIGLDRRPETVETDGVATDHTIDIQGDTADVIVGGDNRSGRLELLDHSNRRWASLKHDPSGESTVRLRGSLGTSIELLAEGYEDDATTSPRIRLDSLAETASGPRARLELGTESGGHGEFVVRKDGSPFCSIKDGVLTLTGFGLEAGVRAKQDDGQATAGLSASGSGGFFGMSKSDGSVTVQAAASSGLMLLGGGGEDGVIGLSTASGTTQGMIARSEGLLLFDADDNPALRVSPSVKSGSVITAFDGDGNEALRVDADGKVYTADGQVHGMGGTQ